VNDTSPRLTEREHEVLSLIADGFSVCEIAAELEVRPSGVGPHIGQIHEKLDARTRAHAVGIAFRAGLLEA
jgi:two-component system, NarL family, nitrate/nitrite response regulator NarL